MQASKLLLVVATIGTLFIVAKFASLLTNDRVSDDAASLGCGKICSYTYDTKVDSKFYPLLRKRVNCKAIFNRMLNPPFKVIKPPPRHPPTELIQNYTQDGACPIKYYYRFIDESASSQQYSFTADQFNKMLERDKVHVINTYGGSNALNFTLWKYIDYIRDKHVAVIGTQIPWAEAMMINRGARQVTTCEYNPLTIDHPRIIITTPYKLAEKVLSDKSVQELFDSAFTFSSLEHTGLGRYGDPIMPFGDMETVAQLWCLIKPGGLLFLGIPVSADRKECWYEWNAHRVYGYVRLRHVTANWEVLDDVTAGTSQYHAILVLKKVSDSL